MSKIPKATKFAKKKHQHQFRDDKKTPYWKHLEIVVNNLILFSASISFTFLKIS